MKNKATGTVIGSIIGDALGVPLEFSRRDSKPKVTDMVGGGVFNLPIGGWTDDTSMTLALMKSLIDNKGFNPFDVQDNFLAWRDDGCFSYNGCFDIGVTTYEALEAYGEDKTTPFTGLTHKMSAGNGSIMRLSPVFCFYSKEQEKGRYVAVEQSKLTHAHPLCLEYSLKCADVVYEAFNGKLHQDILSQKGVHRDGVWSNGYVVNTYKAACWAISQTDNFKDALILAVNLADDADTVGAVTGMFAGALYGVDDIPKEWVDCLVWSKEIVDEVDLLYTTGSEGAKE